MVDPDTSCLERYAPKHPLPEALQDLLKNKHTETVCSYCGVSYLIHHEMKRLEEHCHDLEQKLALYNASVEGERIAKEEVKSLRNFIDEQKIELHKNVSIIGTLSSKQKQLSDSNSSMKSIISDLTQSLEESRTKENYLSNEMMKIQSMVSSLKEQSHDSKRLLMDVLSKYQHDVSLSGDVLFKKIKDYQSECENELTSSLNQLRKEATEKGKLLECARLTSEKNGACISELQLEVEKMKDDLKKKRQINVDLRKELSARDEDFIQWKEKRNFELEQHSSQAKKRLSECETEKYSLQEKVQILEKMLTGKQDSLVKRDEDIASMQLDLEKVRSDLEEERRSFQERLHSCDISASKMNDVQRAQLRAEEECTALKREREMMILAHQDRMEDLKKCFKAKLDKCRTQLENLEKVLEEERNQFTHKQDELETKLSESHKLDFQIEREKYEKMYQEINSLRDEKYKVSMLEETLKNVRVDAEKTHCTLKKEVESLKRVIKDLEDRIAKMNLQVSTEDYENLEAQLSETKAKLHLANSEHSSYKKSLEESCSLNTILKETVRKECEERFELTEALSKVKEELLLLKGFNSTVVKTRHCTKYVDDGINSNTAKAASREQFQNQSSSRSVSSRKSSICDSVAKKNIHFRGQNSARIFESQNAKPQSVKRMISLAMERQS